MNQKSKFLLLMSIAALMTGCKLAVFVLEGGEVQSDASGTCVGSSICVVDVSDPNFSETFTAVPDTGWYFQKWNAGDRLFCGGSTNPTCTLSFQGYEESKEVADIVASSEMFYLMPIFKPSEINSVDGKITVNGKQWLQTDSFSGYSYDQVSAVCPGRVCSGFLPGSTTDLTGYTWASSDDFYALSEAYRNAGRAIFADFDYVTDKVAGFAFVLLSDPPQQCRGTDDVSLCAILAIVGGNIEYPNRVNSVEIVKIPFIVGGPWFWR
jgi:hypothetical protein